MTMYPFVYLCGSMTKYADQGYNYDLFNVSERHIYDMCRLIGINNTFVWNPANKEIVDGKASYEYLSECLIDLGMITDACKKASSMQSTDPLNDFLSVRGVPFRFASISKPFSPVPMILVLTPDEYADSCGMQVEITFAKFYGWKVVYNIDCFERSVLI